MKKGMGLFLALLFLLPYGKAQAAEDKVDDSSTLTAKATVEEVVEDDAVEEGNAGNFENFAWETTLGNDDESAEQQ